MAEQSEPRMQDPTDRNIHSKAGKQTYPASSKGAVNAKNPSDDTVDPANVNPSAPHDRGSIQDGNWRSGIDDAEKKVADDGAKGAWRKGLTQDDHDTDR